MAGIIYLLLSIIYILVFKSAKTKSFLDYVIAKWQIDAYIVTIIVIVPFGTPSWDFVSSHA